MKKKHDMLVQQRRKFVVISLQDMGLFKLLDEESRFPSGTDSSMVAKLQRNLDKSRHFGRIAGEENAFYIRHYAGEVRFNTPYKRNGTTSLICACGLGFTNSDHFFVTAFLTDPLGEDLTVHKNTLHVSGTAAGGVRSGRLPGEEPRLFQREPEGRHEELAQRLHQRSLPS